MKSVLITGASTGIGRATALRLDRAGWRVFAGVRKEADADSLCAGASERLLPLMLDVTDAAQIATAAERIGSDAGEGGLDGLVNNAGIGLLGPLETLPIEDFRRAIEVNLIAQVAVTQTMLPYVRAARGRIVFVSSVGGRMAMPFGSPYHAAKFGLEAVADSLRRELRPWGIEVVSIEPGSIDTPIWARANRAAEEIAARTPAAQEALYGSMLERFDAAVGRTASRGIPPERAARTIARALTSRRPRTRYPVGTDARTQMLAARFLPDRLLDRAIAHLIGL
ncbi:MAG TPA: SDR family oxidoreductase [Solirubrobacterales bacterium]|nr:SDR family oxidoreductase [Solirubrobacterales bacterium]